MSQIDSECKPNTIYSGTFLEKEKTVAEVEIRECMY